MFSIVLQGGPLPEERARRLFHQLIVAIDFCHRLGIANRDIKVLSSSDVDCT
jgi:serine/threonine protein kinase